MPNAKHFRCLPALRALKAFASTHTISRRTKERFESTLPFFGGSYQNGLAMARDNHLDENLR